VGIVTTNRARRLIFEGKALIIGRNTNMGQTMLKLIQNTSEFGEPSQAFYNLTNSISKANNLEAACDAAADYLSLFDMELLCVFFCDLENEYEEISAYQKLPFGLSELIPALHDAGKRPIRNHVYKTMRPFSWADLPEPSPQDFLLRKFKSEVSRLPYSVIMSVPVAIGRGVGVFSIGMKGQGNSAHISGDIVTNVCQIAVALIGRFPELATLFELKLLRTLEAEALLFATNGHNNNEIAQYLGLSELTVEVIFDSAAKRLGAKNLSQTVAKALALGEISNMQC